MIEPVIKITINVCDECESLFILETSKMRNLCPQCAHVLYGYENCEHHFENGRCTKCYWDGSTSAYLDEKEKFKVIRSLPLSLGLLLGCIIPAIAFILSYFSHTPAIIYNGGSMLLNITGFVIVTALMILFTRLLCKDWPVSTATLFTLSLFLIIHFSLSFLVSWINSWDDIDNDGKGLSWIIVFPVTYLISVIWGSAFDKLKNKSGAPSGEAD